MTAPDDAVEITDSTTAVVLVPVTTLYSMAQELLTRVLASFTALGVAVPDRQLIYMSPIPADCSQVAVLFSGWEPVPPIDGVVQCAPYRWAGNFSVVIVRATCALPDRRGNAPSVALMMEAAAAASADAEVLLDLANGLSEAGVLEINISPPEGGYQSVSLDVLLPAYGGLE